MSPLRAAAVAALALTAACEEKAVPTAAPQARSQGVQAAPTAAPTAVAVAPASAAVPSKPRPVLCAQQLGKDSKDAPKAAISRAGDTARLPEKLPVGGGKWSWVNLWAAWCVPCKEEMPRLLSWEQKLAGEKNPLQVLFISLDDDARQLETFLGSQPAGGIKATYWLKDGPERVAWLKEAGVMSEPELPAHILVDPVGHVRCVQPGAIEDADYGEIEKIVRGQRGRPSKATEGDGKHGHKTKGK